jgi:hypothetical protein
VERRLLQLIHRTHGQGSGGEVAAAMIPESVAAWRQRTRGGDRVLAVFGGATGAATAPGAV